MAKSDFSSWSKEELVRELKKVEKGKKYGIVWEDKPEKVAESCKEKLPVLKEDKNREILTDKEKPVNILIEGDNYHSLSVLNYTHKNSIDVIYIDPPYNTGNKDFKYNDSWIDSEDSYRHSKWLSFMEKRLKLAKELMSDSGVIFISIDDNEQANLKLLCDDIFGENNFIANLIWNKKNVVQNDAKYFSINHEYVLCYARNIEKTVFNLLPRTEEQNSRYDNPDQDPRGVWTSVALQAKSGSQSNVYELTFPNGVKWKPSPGTFPRLNRNSLLRAYEEGRLWFGKSGKNVPRLKKYLNEVKQGVVSNSLLLPSEVGSTQSAKERLKRILNKNIFETPKPVDLVKRFIRLNTGKNGLILDFFAGSGTTGHAVMELNEEDGGNRKFILCTNNEDNNGGGSKICSDICYPRLKEVIGLLESGSETKSEKHRPGGLKYFRTDFVEAKQTDQNKRILVDKSTEMLCLKENCFDEVLNSENFMIFKNTQDKYLGIIYDDSGIRPFKKEAKRLKNKFIVYVFSLDYNPREEEFEDMSELVDLKPIPASILNVYRRIFK